MSLVGTRPPTVDEWDGMLLSLTIGFWLIACLEMSVVRSYFKENSGKYRQVLVYFKEYWPLVVTNFLYTLGLYVHNFVFWTTYLHMIVLLMAVCVVCLLDQCFIPSGNKERVHAVTLRLDADNISLPEKLFQIDFNWV